MIEYRNAFAESPSFGAKDRLIRLQAGVLFLSRLGFAL